MPWTQADIPNLHGRVAVVTGANGGLGLETTAALAAAGAHVVMAARNPTKTESAVREVRERVPDADLEVVPLDLGDLASVRGAAAAVTGAHEKVDLLVNNAGVMAMPERQTADGFEMQLGVDHLGHWALTSLLLEPLLRAEAARVVTVTSVARFQGRPVDPDNPHLHGRYGPWRSYGQAKLANYLFGLGLEQEFRNAGVAAQSLVAHPGLSHTELQVHTVNEGGGGVMAPVYAFLARTSGMSSYAGVRPQLRAATDPEAHGGALYGPLLATNGPAVRRPVLRRLGLDRRVRELWQVSERETGIALDVAGARDRLS